MPNDHSFEYLPLVLRSVGPARLTGGGSQSPQTKANRITRATHSAALSGSASALSANWRATQLLRQDQNLPALPAGIPILVKVDPSLDLDALRDKFSFEIVAEQEEGYVIVASADIDLVAFQSMVNAFSVEVHGSATIASVHQLFSDPEQNDRLKRILSDQLQADWPNVQDALTYVIDAGIACAGTTEIPRRPKRGKRDSDASWARKESDWSNARANAYNKWDDIRLEREAEIEQFVNFYGAEILRLVDGVPFSAGVLPDSFTVRLKIVGLGFKDFVLNYPYIFEVVEPEQIGEPTEGAAVGELPVMAVFPIPPEPNAPAVCVIDSGIQEGHALLGPAIDTPNSFCFLPGQASTNVGDLVAPGGHGTRVAGAVVYGEEIPKEGAPQLPIWIQNARVLNEKNVMPVELFPPQAIRAAVERFHQGLRGTRIFNHSINANSFCRTRHMSSWAAEIDALSEAYDVLIVQSAGNLPIVGISPYLGVKDHIAAGRDYPDYFKEKSARIASPGQSLQALTVGSIGYGAESAGEWKTFAPEGGHPSAFSRSGPGIWKVIKPEVVEYGGDNVWNQSTPTDVQAGGRVPAACPELVRSTMFPPGPALDRDEAGTSFAVPKVARLAAELQRLLPDEPALLYRALIVQSARWPGWAEELLQRLRTRTFSAASGDELALMARASEILSSIGYGLPDTARATSNTDHRTTLITRGDVSIGARECHMYQVPIPPELRQQADEFDIRIDVTLSWVAVPRRTRRNLRRYLSTWVDWKSSKLGEGLQDFRARALKEEELDATPLTGSVLPWTLHEMPNWGLIRDFRRSSGTVQKDWAVVKSNTLPDHFCIAVVGHQGWSLDPDSVARYTLAVTLEVIGQEIAIYEPLRSAVIELQAEIEQVEVEAEIEISD